VTPDEAAASVQEVPLDLGASVQNITNMSSWMKEGMSEPYSSINTFSQLLMVIFKNYYHFIDGTYREFSYFFNFA
jgi:hypothetical protein